MKPILWNSAKWNRLKNCKYPDQPLLDTHNPECTKVTQRHPKIGHMFYPLRQMSSRRPRETAKLMTLGSWSRPSKVNGTIKSSEANDIAACKKVKLHTPETGLLSPLKSHTSFCWKLKAVWSRWNRFLKVKYFILTQADERAYAPWMWNRWLFEKETLPNL